MPLATEEIAIRNETLIIYCCVFVFGKRFTSAGLNIILGINALFPWKHVLPLYRHRLVRKNNFRMTNRVPFHGHCFVFWFGNFIIVHPST
jgi:hypothetical protein